VFECFLLFFCAFSVTRILFYFAFILRFFFVFFSVFSVF
jgi:hypothetical protein